MCSSDITPLPWVWDEQSGEAKELADVQHTCRNFEKIKQWGKENKAKHFRKEKIRKEDLVDWAKVS